MFEAALDARVETSTERKVAIAELFAVGRLLANLSNNVNQIARFANSEGRLSDDAEAIVAEARAMVARVDQTIVKVANS